MVSFFFFFKQKTAYEMRISDWSSDVCSSDLLVFDDAGAVQHRVDAAAFGIQAIDDGTQRRFIANIAGKVFDLGTGCAQARQIAADFAVGEDARDSAFDLDRLGLFAACERLLERSEERRVGKGCVSPCKSRGAPSH